MIKIKYNREGTIHIIEPYGKCIILKYRNCDDIDIKFLETRYVSRHNTVSNLKRKVVKDYLYKYICDVGFLGEDFKRIKLDKDIPYKKIRSIWSNMIHRCYDTKHVHYKNYGGRGVIVSDRWLNFSKFAKDFIRMDGYVYDDFILGKLELDKDKLCVGNKIYSRDTCCLITRKENINLRRTTKVCDATSPEGITFRVHNISELARRNNLIISSISLCLSGKMTKHHGWKFKNVE